ncbi:uncharacterized protein LOC127838570 isoform X1 [Dreissena polymorpha]|uniref:uncharacterized protein LOC127838570 isoform X1 n=1 Tax=Dreissena polymorpha TaxID=45954 RepID=UPI0022653ACE|nr:uncharacterized protein LOC127838570 isoform X1 [Dreissena polymorpha]
MRNSYINPIKCHTCGETIKPFINADWGAILVHGYDGENKEVFKKDIAQFEKVITSKVLPAMCMSSENVIICENKEQIDRAIATLFKNTIETVMFVYSGHNDDRGRGLQLGKDEFYPLTELSDKLNKLKKKKANFDKVIVFLDCCYPDKINLKGLKLIQINATAPTVEAKADTNTGSPFLQYIIQAFTATANGKGCNVPNCECSDILQDSFITLDTLCDYLNEHFKNGELKLDMPSMNADNISLQDTVLAYNCNFKVQFEFTILYPGKKETRSMRVLPSEFNTFDQLKSIGAAEVIKHVCDMISDSSTVITKVADTLSIEINTGPRSKHIQEVDTIEKLLLAWTSKRILRCTARPLYSINVGKPVGRLLKGVPEIRNAHQAALQKCAMKDQHLTDIKKYKDQIDKIQNADYLSILDMIIHQTKEEQLKGNRWEISFFDLPNSFTLVHLRLVKIGGI